MIKLDQIGNRIILLVVISCFLRMFATTEVPSVQNISETSSDVEHLKRTEIPGSDKTENATTGVSGKRFPAEGSRISENGTANESGKTFDRIKEFFHPFLSLPFFPLHILDAKGNTPQVKSSGGDMEIAGNRSRRKPFLFLDFALNIEEIPMRNQTKRDNLDDDQFELEEIRSGENFEGKKSKERVDVIDDDWPFLRDSPRQWATVDELLPQRDWLFFDFPFRDKQNKKPIRSKMGKLMDIFDSAVSRTEREVERAMPIWKFMRSVDQTEERRDSQLPSESSYSLRDPDATWKERTSTKLNSRDLIRPKNPILLGKAVKIREFRFQSDNYPKNKLKKKRKKKRESSPSPGGSEKLEFRENPVEQGSHRMKDNKRLRTVRGTQDAKIMDLMAQWDRRVMEEQAEGISPKTKTLEIYNERERVPDDFPTAMLKDEKFKYVGQIPGKRKMSKSGAGFEVVKPQQSSPRRKRQENDGSGNWENVTASRDEVRKNIIQVLGQFFSMVRKFGESKNFYQNGETREVNEVAWPELDQGHGSRLYVKDNSKKRREDRQAEVEEKYKNKSAPVSALKFLFMTVTLPTTLAFTLLLVICLFNLRSKSWLCQKVFQNRNVYIVEEDVEKANSFGTKSREEASKNETDANIKVIPVNDDSELKTKKTREKGRAT